jgi:hypothetical protein
MWGRGDGVSLPTVILSSNEEKVEQVVDRIGGP